MKNNKNEIWKDVLDYEGFYEVSNLGRIRSLMRETVTGLRGGRLLKSYVMPRGYHQVALSKQCKAKKFLVHRLVATAFVSNPDNKPAINHKNGIKADNRADNLEWCTNIENSKHAQSTGLYRKGSQVATSKLTEPQVRKIRQLYANGGTSHSQIARLFCVSESLIGFIVNREIWKHVR